MISFIPWENTNTYKGKAEMTNTIKHLMLVLKMHDKFKKLPKVKFYNKCLKKFFPVIVGLRRDGYM